MTAFRKTPDQQSASADRLPLPGSRAIYATAEWVEWFNNRRVHSTLDYRTPAAVEDIYYAHAPAGEPEDVNN